MADTNQKKRIKLFEMFEVDFGGVFGTARGHQTGFELVVYIAHSWLNIPICNKKKNAKNRICIKLLLRQTTITITFIIWRTFTKLTKICSILAEIFSTT